MDARVAHLEADVLMPLGPVRQLEERVDQLEASRGTTSIEMGESYLQTRRPPKGFGHLGKRARTGLR